MKNCAWGACCAAQTVLLTYMLYVRITCCSSPPSQAAFRALFINKLPGLKVVPFDQIKYTDPSRDVGVQALPVTW